LNYKDAKAKISGTFAKNEVTAKFSISLRTRGWKPIIHGNVG